jgi:hypothetical protein
MKKSVKIALISTAIVVTAATILFIVIPLATSKEAETRLSETLAEAGIPEDMWSIDRAYYVPLLGHLVIEKLEFGERGVAFLEVKKVILTLDTGSEDIFAGSVDAQDISFFADDTGITTKKLSVNDFSVNKALFEYSPIEAVKRLGNIHLTDMAFRQRGQSNISLGALNADIGYVEGRIPLSSSVSLKEFVVDVRQFMPLPALYSEYRFSNINFKTSSSSGVYMVDFIIDEANLFTIQADLGVALPHELLASGEIANFALIDYDEDVKLNSFSLAYIDKSLLNHIFELVGMPGDREVIAEQLNETLQEIAIMGGIDMKRFADEAAKFIVKPERLELKTNLNSPMSFTDISQNPFAMNLSLSINGGKPFTTGEN